MTTALRNLEDMAQRIRQAHQLATTGLREALAHAKQAGELLAEAKKQCKHGAWLPWLTAEVGISARTAQTYMQIARRWPELEATADAQRVAHLPLREAVKLLTNATSKKSPAYKAETNERERAVKFEEWVDSALPPGWQSDLALAKQILESPDATIRQVMWAHDLADEISRASSIVTIQAQRELGRIMNDWEKTRGKAGLNQCLANPAEFQAELQRLAEEKFGKGCLDDPPAEVIAEKR